MGKTRHEFPNNRLFTSLNTVITIKAVRTRKRGGYYDRSLICERTTEWKLNR